MGVIVVLGLIGLIAAGFILVERLWPARALPRVRAWWPRVLVINLLQLGLVILAGRTWDRWMQGRSLLTLSRDLGDLPAALITYVVSTFIYYWWHRVRHESALFWRMCHQLHHSPRRIEILTSFYKHPVEITLNAMLSAAIAYPLMGCSLEAGAWYTGLSAVAEFFYHWNVRTPFWIGYAIQRPESHRIHHQYRHHTQNFADLPLWDWLFGTLANARRAPAQCGYDRWREDRFEDLLAFRDVHAKPVTPLSPLHFLPTCIGCRKRWACHEANTIRPAAS